MTSTYPVTPSQSRLTCHSSPGEAMYGSLAYTIKRTCQSTLLLEMNACLKFGGKIVHQSIKGKASYVVLAP